jgi:ABC-2 type transport system ATP-binding protein
MELADQETTSGLGPEINNENDNVAIQLRNISKTFKTIKALDNVSLDIYKNEIFALLGSNGSGKTTLLRILSTLIPADTQDREGRPRVCNIGGYDLFTKQDTVRKIIGYVPQRDALYENLSALDNILLFSAPYDIDRKVKQTRIKDLLQTVRLYDRKDTFSKTFSGGMLKRLSIVCALVHKPSVIFLDEVTVGLDTDLRHEIWGLLKELKKESTIVLTTHYIPDAETYCDRVALIQGGHILDCGRPTELVKKYAPAKNLEEVTLLTQNK